jgi:hypothetical protein
MLYAAKCYWPGVNANGFEQDAAIRLQQADIAATANTAYLGSLVFGGDELVLCLYEASSRAAVTEAAQRARIPWERIMESAWLPAAGSPLSTTGGLP